MPIATDQHSNIFPCLPCFIPSLRCSSNISTFFGRFQNSHCRHSKLDSRYSDISAGGSKQEVPIRSRWPHFHCSERSGQLEVRHRCLCERSYCRNYFRERLLELSGYLGRAGLTLLSDRLADTRDQANSEAAIIDSCFQATINAFN